MREREFFSQNSKKKLARRPLTKSPIDGPPSLAPVRGFCCFFPPPTTEPVPFVSRCERSRQGDRYVGRRRGHPEGEKVCLIFDNCRSRSERPPPFSTPACPSLSLSPSLSRRRLSPPTTFSLLGPREDARARGQGGGLPARPWADRAPCRGR